MDNKEQLTNNETTEKKSSRPTLLRGHWRTVALLLNIYDIVVINLSYYLALWLRFDCVQRRVSAARVRLPCSTTAASASYLERFILLCPSMDNRLQSFAPLRMKINELYSCKHEKY